ncbi:MAG: hydroxylamine reductase, partial [Desulfobacteraceae bacterium]|nr:hydroxylamine reductase [Desulfobacteraceae bacterium]
MFCFQCEQTAKGKGCTKIGVCGKKPEVADLQDVLLYCVKALSQVALAAKEAGATDSNVNKFTVEAIFSTLTNVDFDPDRFVALIRQCVTLRDQLKGRIQATGGKVPENAQMLFTPGANKDDIVAQAEGLGVMADPDLNPDIRSLRELLIYSIKGVAAYTDHACILGREDDTVYQFIYEAMAATLDDSLDVNALVALNLKCGEINLRAMELLDDGNTGTYGHPVPTKVPLGHKKGKAILVSGHDLKDLEHILKQTEAKGIFIYTHGEMLPTHGYPELKKYDHFYGHYGTAWQNQAKEFSKFPGAIIMTTNCIQKPQSAYQDNIFTTGLVGWPGVKHIADKDFSPAIEKALAMPGFTQDGQAKTIMTGFGRNAVMGVAGQVIEAVKNKAIRHFFLVGGCDGAKPGRDYYTRFVEKVPEDCIILTLGCGKFRFFDKDLGDIGGIPRLLDIGQCNDAYSAVKIAVALAEAFNCGVNDLPLSMILSWYEQKACAILLSLLHLGIKDIR